jgi:hypothetical protein
MRKVFTQYNFLPHSLYNDIKSEIDNIDTDKLTAGRSCLDLPEDEIKGLQLPFINHFNELYTNSQTFWKSLCMIFSIDMPRDFREDYIEPKSGRISEKNYFSYSRMDVGWGLEGYGICHGGRGNHIDNYTRIISCILYFSDQSDFEGGEHCLTDSKGNVDQKINIAENLLIASVQDSNAWHKVNPIKKVIKSRISIYFALSHSCTKGTSYKNLG